MGHSNALSKGDVNFTSYPGISVNFLVRVAVTRLALAEAKITPRQLALVHFHKYGKNPC